MDPTLTRTERGNYVLMFVMREFNRELPFVPRFDRLIGVVGFAESKAAILAGRGAHMTDRANHRARGYERLPCEKLLSMTTHTGIMIWKVRDVRENSLSGPLGGNFVTGITA